jgi:acetyl esterase/lipase
MHCTAGDPQRVALLGDSAGGNLAAAVALTLSGPRFLAEFETRVGAVGGRKWRRKKPLCAVVLAR